MNAVGRLAKEFWLPTCIAVAWTAYNVWSQHEGWDVKAIVNIFGPSFFLVSWATGQFFRVKKQQHVDQNLSMIENRVAAVVDRLERHAKDFMGYTTGGDSVGYFIPGFIKSNTFEQNILELIFQNSSEYPIFDIHAEAIDLDESIDPANNRWWTRHRFFLDKIYPSKAVMGAYRFPLLGRDCLRLNIFIHTRTQGVIQQIRVVRKDNWYQIAERVRAGDKVLKYEVPEGFPGHDPSNPDVLFN